MPIIKVEKGGAKYEITVERGEFAEVAESLGLVSDHAEAKVTQIREPQSSHGAPVRKEMPVGSKNDRLVYYFKELPKQYEKFFDLLRERSSVDSAHIMNALALKPDGFGGYLGAISKRAALYGLKKNDLLERRVNKAGNERTVTFALSASAKEAMKKLEAGNAER